jgi:precorrin-6B methylase 2
MLSNTSPLQAERTAIRKKGKIIIEKMSAQLTVLNGPFKGLRYPHLDIPTSSLPSRIAGSYEMQLHPTIQKIIQTPYTHLIDVGCAEGYYAVGFALNMAATTIHCFDTNVSILNFCKSMATLNGVQNITYNDFCAPDTLIHFDFGTRSFIFCDCEGYELQLFTKEVIHKLKKVDILIELHDVFNPQLSAELLPRFQETHHLQIINNLNPNFASLQGLESLSEAEKTFTTFEHRGGFCKDLLMEWAFLMAK